MRSAVTVVVIMILITTGAYALRTAYQAGYAAHQVLSDAERASTLRANANVARRAAETLFNNIRKAAALDEETDQTLLEIESYEKVPYVLGDKPAPCGISVDRLRLLDAIR